MVKTYSVRKNGNTKLSDNFTVREFACQDGSDKVLIDTDLVKILQKIRDHFGKPITINSAYRSASHNRKVGGVSNSQHVKGTAADIIVSGVAPVEVAKYAEYIMPNKGGIGVYSSFVHIDVRTSRSRWTNYGIENPVSGFPGYTEPVKELESVNDIVWGLHNRGIITDKELWLKKITPNSNGYWLAYKAANMTANTDNHKNLNTVNDIVWELNQRGILTNKELWLDLLTKDVNLYWLANKVCNQTKNK